MADRARRKALRQEYEQTKPGPGVYRLVNQRNGKSLLGSAMNLASVRNKLEFARSTGSVGALDYRLRHDVAEHGVDAFTFEILEVLEPSPEQTRAQIAADLATLEALWREKFDPGQLY